MCVCVCVCVGGGGGVEIWSCLFTTKSVWKGNFLKSFVHNCSCQFGNLLD